MKLAKSQIFIIVINSILFLIGFVLMFSFSVKASSPSGQLPYVVPYMRDTLNNAIPSQTVSDIDTYLRNYHSLSESDRILYFLDTYDNMSEVLGDYEWNSISYVINPSIPVGINDSFNYLTNTISISGYGGTIDYKWTGQFRGPYNMTYSGNILGSYTTNTISQGYFTRLYPFYLSGLDIYSRPVISEGSGTLIFTNNVPYSPDIPTQGHAVSPTNNPNNIINGSNNLPITKPTFPTINYYTYTSYSPPSIDTSNVESILESIYDLIEYNLDYQTSNFVGQWSNLLNNMGNLTDYIVKSFENGFNKVVLSIQDMTTDLYNNFVSLFEPITTQINYIISPVDTDFIISGISETEFYNGFEDTKDFFYTVDTIFDIPEPDHFIIEIHLEDLSFFDSGLLDFNLPTVYLNLGSNILPFRNALRVFLWCMVSVGTVFYVQKNLPSMIKGDEIGGTGDVK